MKKLPETDEPIVLRTDFSNDGAWKEICAAIKAPGEFEDFVANVHFVDDREYAGATTQALLKTVSDDHNHSFIMVVDKKTIANREHPILIIDLLDEPGREFRAVPAQIQSIENNLSLSNMGFDEFADSADDDGIFRGFHDGSSEDE